MRKKKSLSIWILLIYITIYLLMILVFYGLNNLSSVAKNIFEFPSVILHISPVVMIFFGIIMNFETIIKLSRKKGKVSIDWLRLMIVVIPLTGISFLNLVQYFQVSNPIMLTHYIRPPVIYVAQFMQGFFLVSCFSKSGSKKDLEKN